LTSAFLRALGEQLFRLDRFFRPQSLITDVNIYKKIVMSTQNKIPGFFARILRLRLPEEVMSENGRLIIDKNGNVRPNFNNQYLQQKMIQQFSALDLNNTQVDSYTEVKA